jgi:hypothetical protein
MCTLGDLCLLGPLMHACHRQQKALGTTRGPNKDRGGVGAGGWPNANERQGAPHPHHANITFKAHAPDIWDSEGGGGRTRGRVVALRTHGGHADMIVLVERALTCIAGLVCQCHVPTVPTFAVHDNARVLGSKLVSLHHEVFNISVYARPHTECPISPSSDEVQLLHDTLQCCRNIYARCVMFVCAAPQSRLRGVSINVLGFNLRCLSSG